ncbi:hypothetical protein [Clostridium sp.]|uniref:hypothetical protein n=1 Tax=Clostridium sp. TaxID=1506 RepID=UPI0025870BB0|nr:hypothetical protein [Clostridium sp.]MDF2504336.1 hypothetical protein [Clostridium sp.]
MINNNIKQYYYNLYKEFYVNAGIMSCFVKSLIFVSVVNMSNLSINENVQIDISKIKSFENEDDLIILDIPANVGLEYAYKYKDKYTIIPDFNMVCHDFGIVKSNSILRNLTLFSDIDLKNNDKYMIILDSNRYKDIEIDNINEYNNQYEITEEDLPELEMIKLLKLNNISYIYDKKIKEDIGEYLNYLKANKVNINIRHL